MLRHLQITKRRIPLERTEQYGDLWRAVREAAAIAGARAWLFRASPDSDRFAEFIEWQSEQTGFEPDLPAVGAARAALNATFPFEESDTWLEARI